MVPFFVRSLPRVAPPFGAPSLLELAGLDEDDTEKEGDEEEKEDMMWLLGRADDSPRTWECEGSKWPPDF